VLAQTALALADSEKCVPARGRLEIAFVAYREWAKLIATSLAISITITAIGLAFDAFDPNRTSLHRKTRAASGCPVTKSTDMGSQG
jgi:hypothetical protein